MSNKAVLSFDGTYTDQAFYCTLLTSNDSFTSNLRYSGLTSEAVSFMKQREKSAGASGTSALDQVGWMVIESGAIVGTGNIETTAEEGTLKIFPTLTRDILDVTAEWGTRIFIYSVGGSLVKNLVYRGISFSVCELSAGMYILRTDKGESGRFVKID